MQPSHPQSRAVTGRLATIPSRPASAGRTTTGAEPSLRGGLGWRFNVVRIARPVAGDVDRDRFVFRFGEVGLTGRFGIEAARRQRFERRRVVMGPVAKIPGYGHDG